MVRTRKRGTAMSSPLANVFSEVVLFSMERAITRYAKDGLLHRLHDDFWIWGLQDECVKAWHAVAELTRVMGLDSNEDKPGSERRDLPEQHRPRRRGTSQEACHWRERARSERTVRKKKTPLFHQETHCLLGVFSYSMQIQVVLR